MRDSLRDGALLKDTREKLNISRRKLAREAGISARLLDFFENNKIRMSDEHVDRPWELLVKHEQERLAQKTPAVIRQLLRIQDGRAIMTKVVEEKL